MFPEISAALGSIKAATDIAKFIKESDLSLEKAETKLKLADLISALADAKLEMVSVQESLVEAKDQIKALEKQLAIRESVVWKAPFYWQTATTGREGPFCQKCYDTQTRLVRLQDNGDGEYRCLACNNFFTTEERRARDAAAVHAVNRSRGSGFY